MMRGPLTSRRFVTHQIKKKKRVKVVRTQCRIIDGAMVECVVTRPVPPPPPMPKPVPIVPIKRDGSLVRIVEYTGPSGKTRKLLTQGGEPICFVHPHESR